MPLVVIAFQILLTENVETKFEYEKVWENICKTFSSKAILNRLSLFLFPVVV